MTLRSWPDLPQCFDSDDTGVAVFRGCCMNRKQAVLRRHLRLEQLFTRLRRRQVQFSSAVVPICAAISFAPPNR